MRTMAIVTFWDVGKALLRRDCHAQATSRLSGSRAKAIPSHVTLCFLNLPNVRLHRQLNHSR